MHGVGVGCPLHATGRPRLRPLLPRLTSEPGARVFMFVPEGSRGKWKVLPATVRGCVFLWGDEHVSELGGGGGSAFHGCAKCC